MEKNSLPPVTPAYLPSDPEMASAVPHIAGDPNPSSLFDWSDFLDFDVDEALNTSFLQPELGPALESEPETSQSQPSENSGRIRKRDPRLLCPNFAAGRIPCACPELDRQLAEQEEEEAAGPGKKRARVVRASSGGPLRCQVPGCEADISELKGYHKRHRVCLQCAHASSVMLEGEEKRYCQQCGKFHVLANFDEGKRSCRMKLDIHNRRRKKSNDSKVGTGKEAQLVIFSDDVKDDDDTEKDGTSLSSQSEERETLLESDGHISTISSAPSSQNLQGESVLSFDAPREIQVNGQKQSPKSKRSASYPENKSKFSSVCPAGRISFKLYDWNPAEFPRRLRLQIFEWLASMPIELEGYIRPGCTILTAFIAMPKPMWLKLKEKPAFYIKDLVTSPENMLFGRGTMLVYLNDMVFRVTRDSVIQVSVKDRSPKLHYIYPTCFEAGRPMEFVACGSNLLQSKFRFLVSFAGRYLAYNICVSSLCCKKGNSNNFDHQLVKISIPQTDVNIFGPAFIEVENQSGLSNFIPILIGDKETCAEMEILQSDSSLSSQERQCSPPMPSCEVLAVRQKQFSGFVLDVAWSLKKPVTDQPLTSFNIQRFNYLLDFLIEKESSVILDRIFCSLESAIDINSVVAGVSDSDMKSLREKMVIAQSMLGQNLREKVSAVMPAFHAVKETKEYKIFSSDLNDTIPLINAGLVTIHTRPRKSCSLLPSRTFLTSRPLIMAITTVCVCFGICVAVFHPQKASEIATTIRRCLFDRS